MNLAKILVFFFSQQVPQEVTSRTCLVPPDVATWTSPPGGSSVSGVHTTEGSTVTGVHTTDGSSVSSVHTTPDTQILHEVQGQEQCK